MKQRMGNSPFNPGVAGENGQENRFCVIERCWNCPNAVIDIDNLEKNILKVMIDLNFEKKRENVLKTGKPLHHQVFKISVSGCPNSCSQPQIKDLGIQGQAIPEVGEGCTLCGECVQACPDCSIILSEKGPEINRKICLNCGRCVRVCPAGVLTSRAGGFRVLVGGKLGRRPRLAETVVVFGREEAVEAALKVAADLLTAPEFAEERLGSVIEKMGIDWFKEKL